MDKDLQDLKDAIKQRKDELDLAPIDKPQTKLETLTASNKFTETIDDAKVNVVQDASVNDPKFVEDFKSKLKEATLKSAELEKQKQELENQYIALQQEYITTKRDLEKQQQQENKWSNKEKARQYHYNGLKDIMLFLGMQSPGCIPWMYTLAIIISPVYLLWTLLVAPIWTLIVGKNAKDRPMAVKGAIWTISLLFCVTLLVFFVYAVGKFCFGWF